MNKVDFLALSDEKVISFLRSYKEKKSLSYEQLAIRIGCHREPLSKFMRGQGAGTKVRRLIYEWCADNIYTDSAILTYTIKHIYNPDILSKDSSDYTKSECEMLERISSVLIRRLREVAQKPNPKYRLTALENFF